MKITTTVIKNFLDDFKGATIQLGMVNGQGKLIMKNWFHGTQEAVEKARIINEKTISDVFFTPNGHYSENFKTSSYLISPTGKGRDGAHGTFYNSISFDFDEEGLAKIEEFEKIIKDINEGWGLNYRYKIKTKHGFHYHFLFDVSQNKTEINKTYKEFYDLVCGLFKADPSTKDISRLFRLPGFRYWKGDSNNKQEIEIVEYNKGATITIDQIETILKNTKYLEEKEQTNNNQAIEYSKTVFDECQKLDILDVIHNLSKTTKGRIGISNNYHLIIDGEFLSGLVVWKEKNRVNDFTGAKKGQRPFGGVYNFVKMALKDDQDQIFNFFKSYYSIDVKKAMENRIYFTSISGAQIIIDKNTSRTETVYTVNNKKMVKTLLDFYFEPLGFIIDQNNEKKLIVKVVKEGKTLRVLPYENKAYLQFKIAMKKECGGLAFNATDKEYEAIEEMTNFIAKDKPELIYCHGIGFNTKGNYVLNNEQIVIIKEDTIEIKKTEFGYYKNIYISQKIKSHTTERFVEKKYCANECLNELDKFLEVLPKRYNPEKSIPAMLSIVNALFFPFYLSFNLPYRPHLVMLGQTQSGKTSLLTELSQLIPTFLKIASSSTPLSILLASTIGCPVFLTEFNKEGMRRDDIYKMINNAYDGDVFEKGKPDLSVAKFHLTGNFVLDTEFGLSNEKGSSRTRCIELLCNTNDYGDINALSEINFKKVRMGLLHRTFFNIKKQIKNKNAIKQIIQEYSNVLKIEIEKIEQRNKEIPETKRLTANFGVLLFVATMIYKNEDLNKVKKYLIKALLEQAKTISTISVGAKTVGSILAYLTEYVLFISKTTMKELNTRITIQENGGIPIIMITANLFKSFLEKYYKIDLSQSIAPIVESGKIVDSPYYTFIDPTKFKNEEKMLLENFLYTYQQNAQSETDRQKIANLLNKLEDNE